MKKLLLLNIVFFLHSCSLYNQDVFINDVGDISYQKLSTTSFGASEDDVFGIAHYFGGNHLVIDRYKLHIYNSVFSYQTNIPILRYFLFF